jgi:heme exporter protein D
VIIMDLGPHADFIILAYVTAAVIVAALVAWVLIDYRSQKQVLADLEAQGTGRRSADGKRSVTAGAA